MLSYIIRRLLLIVPTLLGITLITFGVMALSPGGIQSALTNREGGLDPRARAAVRAYYEKKYGLNKPLPVQYLRWLNKVSPFGVKDEGMGWPVSWLIGLKTPDLGESIISHRPVLDMIEESLPLTLLLNAVSIPLMLFISLWTGIASAKNRGGLLDVGGGSILLGLWSVPQIWAGVLLIGYLANKNILHLFPPAGLHDLRADDMNFLPSFAGGFQRGWLLDTAWHLVLPVICLTYTGFAFSSKLTRGAMLENMSLDFVRTARAKGLSEREVLYRHVFRNSVIPLITNYATLLPSLIGGAIVIESIFSIPGMGKLTVDSVSDKDPELVLSTTLVAGILGLISYLIADILYVVADPRVNYEVRAT
ncbi:MAG: ABC transporter permease [Planctomycetota bacterium]|nr:ABC transporter permease [Planctomycetota bacterium]